ncbi:MAG: hypothetical protein Q9184_000163 [Pyrenodesmia sp. 2 TL-2023]
MFIVIKSPGLTIPRYRIACQTLALEHFDLAANKSIESKLWDVHVRVNGRFRKHLGDVSCLLILRPRCLCSYSSRVQFQGLKGKEKKPVEKRKAAKAYLDFVKASQRFYRGYIQKLASQFGRIPELEAVAHRFSLDAAAAVADSEEKLETTARIRHKLLQSCHQSLIHLGDLSRYRESELNVKGKDRNWGPAIGYYDLAIAINPASGLPHNQLAIISKSEGDHARALYHLYRAQNALEPPPTAFANLQLEFKKIREASERSNTATESHGESDHPLVTLQRCVPLLHACCFNGTDFPEYTNIETQILGRLSAGLRRHCLETSFVNRMVLSNIAADFIAGDRWQDAPELSQNEVAFKFFQILNAQTFRTLLRLLLVEYENRSKPDRSDGLDVLTPASRRLLPGLRLYSSWLITRAALLSAHLGDATFGKSIKDFWATYVEVLTLILSTTSFANLPQVEYLLEEDEEIIGFGPLQEEQHQRKFLDPGTLKRKPKCYEQGVKRHHPNVETLCRIRDFVEDAIELAENEFVPIKFVHKSGLFVLQDHQEGARASQASFNEANRLSPAAAEQVDTSHAWDTSLPDNESTTDDAVSQGTSLPLSLSTTMNRMVDDLVGPQPSISAALLSSTPPGQDLASTHGDGLPGTSYGVGHSTLTALDFVNQVRSWSPKEEVQDQPKPSLPSILNSPFAPRPEEQSALTGLRTSHKRQHSQAMHPTQSQQQLPNHSIESQASSMSDTQLSYTTNGHLLHPSLKNKAFGKRQQHASHAYDFNFDSSNIITGSSFPFNNGRNQASQPTPPNGQG